jgi:hypothetical protein
LPPREAGLAKLAFVGLQQRLLSSPAAFAATLEVYLEGLDRRQAQSATTAESFTAGAAEEEEEPEAEQEGLLSLERDEAASAEAAAAYAAPVSDREAVMAMLELARTAARKPDARVKWLVDWIRANMTSGGSWNQRRLVIFTESEATRRWLERRLVDVNADMTSKLLALMLCLSMIERVLLKERPAWFATAGHRGGGKTTLVVMLTMEIFGRLAAAAAWSDNEAERRRGGEAEGAVQLPASGDCGAGLGQHLARLPHHQPDDREGADKPRGQRPSPSGVGIGDGVGGDGADIQRQ